MLYFLPTALLFPLYYLLEGNARVEEWFLSTLIWSIESCGSVVIKLAQYASHRPDLVNQKLIQKFQHLRQSAPVHSFEETTRVLRRHQLEQDVQIQGRLPLASGVIGQVYTGYYQGRRAAVKVRHPEVTMRMKEDLDLIYQVTSFLSHRFQKIFGWMEMPVTISEFTKVLIDQTDFRIEAEHLFRFRENFRPLGDMIKFPEIFLQREDLLVEELIENSESITDFLQRGQHSENQRLAKIGLNTFFRMLIYDNFVHADCHGGNILVQRKGEAKKPSRFDKISEFIFNQCQTLNFMVLKATLDHQQTDQTLILEGFHKMKNDYYNLMMSDSSKALSTAPSNTEYQMYLIDTGMSTHLLYEDHKNILKLLKSVISRDPK